MAIGTFRSNSSASTTMTVNIFEIWRSGTQVGLRCEFSVTTGSASSLGAATDNWRNLKLTHVNGTLLSEATIKAAMATWSASSTYSGSWDFAVDIGTYDSGTISIIPSTNTTGTQSCIWTTYVSQLDVAFSETWSNASAPTAVSISPAAFEDSVVANWSGAAAGINNSITGYKILYSVNGGADQSVTLGVVSTHTFDTSGWARGTTIKARVQVLTQRGDNPVTGYTATLTKNRTPNQPTSPSVPKASYIPGETIRVSFANTGDPDNNLTGFEVATDVNTTIVGTRASSSATYVDVDTDGWAQGIQRKFRVRGYDAQGVRGPWSTYTALVTLNTAPNAPVISYPAAGSTVYNTRPHILLKAGTANDGPDNILCVTDTAERTTALNGTLFSCGTNSDLTSGQQVVFKPSTVLGSAPTISSRMYDSFLYSSSVSRPFNISAFAPTDPDISISGMLIKAVHITDLRAAIDHLRTAYGLAAATWSTCTAGLTVVGNSVILTELQTNLQAVIDKINTWASGGTFDLSITWMDPAAAGGGVDALKLRQAIEQLRTTVQLI